MNIAKHAFDSLTGLVNSLSGLGTAKDKATGGVWQFLPLDDNQLECAYRGSWMAKKAVDIPAFDMVRAGWEWNAEKDVIKRIEAAEKKHKVRRKIFDAQSSARLYGGSGIILSDGSENPEEPLEPERLRRGQLQFMTVLSRRYLVAGDLDRDATSPGYLEPVDYSISTGTQSQIKIHPSRVVRFDGNRIPDPLIQANAVRWSDSVLDSIEGEIRRATSGQQGISALIQEAKIDVIKVPGLTDKIATDDYEQRLMRRFHLMDQLKSLVNSVVIDSDEEWDQKQVTFAGLDDVTRLLLHIVSGAADIPATRFFGQSPQGMNSTGESDMRNYYDRLSAEQNLILRDPMEKIYDVLLASELGSRPDDITFKFNPLWQLSEKEEAEVAKIEAETDQIHVRNATVPLPALEDAIQTRLSESPQYPGIEQALEDFEASGEEDDRRAITGEGEGGDDDDPSGETQDAKPLTLFVQRKLLNADELIAWASAQGFKTTDPADGIHVTIAFSRAPVDWVAMGQDWAGGSDGELTVNPGGPRVVEALGDDGAVVLMFASSPLSWRHEDMKRNGATWDHPEYQPHVTFTHDGAGVDLSQVQAFQPELLFGPEIFAEINPRFAGVAGT